MRKVDMCKINSGYHRKYHKHNFLVSKIAWNDNGWRGFDYEAYINRANSGFGYVNEHGFGHEWWNFYPFDEEYYFGNVAVNVTIPQNSADGSLVLFASKNISDNKWYFVGFYSHVEYGDYTPHPALIDTLDHEAKERILSDIKDGKIIDDVENSIRNPGLFRCRAPRSKSVQFTIPVAISIQDDFGIKSWGQAPYLYVGGEKKVKPAMMRALLEKALAEQQKYIDSPDFDHDEIQETIDKIQTAIGDYFGNGGGNMTETEEINEDMKLLDHLLQKKNQVILYGPPGTGKTYIANQFIKSKRATSIKSGKPIFDRNFYWFTANPKRWDPENLWSGTETDLTIGKVLRSAFESIDVGDIVFMYISSPTRKITGVAECTKVESDNSGNPLISIKGLRRVDGPKWKDIKSDEILSESKPVQMGAQGTLFPVNGNEAIRILELSNISVEELGIKKEIEQEMVKTHEFVTFHPTFSYEDFIEGLRPLNDDNGQISYEIEEGIFKTFARSAFNTLMTRAEIEREWRVSGGIPKLSEAEKERVHAVAMDLSFYLIIDEINRGDISRIFGELITLLEADKRLCAENELITTLPYSKQLFGIPPNLYIIGTMNTADKSIALIDIALRRRFGFIEIMPDYDALKKILVSDDPDIQEIHDLAIEVLKTLNRNILDVYDRDHQIGHSYLIKLRDSSSQADVVDNLRFIWYYEILPLLQEYFYDAPAKLKQVIGDGFVNVEDRSFTFTNQLEGAEFISALRNITHSEAEPENAGGSD